jgi:hypothetical protein
MNIDSGRHMVLRDDAQLDIRLPSDLIVWVERPPLLDDGTVLVSFMVYTHVHASDLQEIAS